jgi:soluble epoxide hydrolase / lipid-phosphate phosphatase
MEAHYYKSFTTSRDLSYSYFHTSSRLGTDGSAGTKYLLLIHGFPFGSLTWRDHVPVFQGRGFGLIIPDLPGYGESSKPHDTQAYRLSLISRDIIEILEHEGLRQVIVVGHDV